MRVCFMSSIPMRHLEQYIHDLEARGIPYLWNEVPDFSFRRKVDWILETASSRPDEWLVFTDAYDMVLLAESASEIEATLERMGPGPHYSGDMECWPVDVTAAYDEYQGTPQSPWRFVNGGGPAGRGSEIAAACRWLIKYHPVTTDLMSHPDGIDQRAWTETYLDGIGQVDMGCELVQSIYLAPPGALVWQNGRLRNTVTGSMPCFAHLCGHSDIAWDGIKGEANIQGEVLSVPGAEAA